MTDKILVETIPVSSEQIPVRRIIQPRGELALIEDGRSFRHLAYFSIKKGEGFFRGGHFHLGKTEYLYLISGRISLKFVDLDTGESSAIELSPGSRVTIHPKCAHRFDALEEAHVIEYFDSLHDRKDDHLFPALMGH